MFNLNSEFEEPSSCSSSSSSSRIPIRFAIRLTEQISSIGLFAVTESQCTEDEHDDEDEDDSKFRNLGLTLLARKRHFLEGRAGDRRKSMRRANWISEVTEPTNSFRHSFSPRKMRYRLFSLLGGVWARCCAASSIVVHVMMRTSGA